VVVLVIIIGVVEVETRLHCASRHFPTSTVSLFCMDPSAPCFRVEVRSKGVQHTKTRGLTVGRGDVHWRDGVKGSGRERGAEGVQRA